MIPRPPLHGLSSCLAFSAANWFGHGMLDWTLRNVLAWAWSHLEPCIFDQCYSRWIVWHDEGWTNYAAKGFWLEKSLFLLLKPYVIGQAMLQRGSGSKKASSDSLFPLLNLYQQVLPTTWKNARLIQARCHNQATKPSVCTALNKIM